MTVQRIRASSSTFAALLAVNSAVMLFGLAGVLGKMTGLPATIIVFGRVGLAAATQCKGRADPLWAGRAACRSLGRVLSVNQRVDRRDWPTLVFQLPTLYRGAGADHAAAASARRGVGGSAAGPPWNLSTRS